MPNKNKKNAITTDKDKKSTSKNPVTHEGDNNMTKPVRGLK